MVWSHNDSWMVTGDHGGYVKYWQSNMNNVKMYQAHKEAIRGIRYCLIIVIVIYHFAATVVASKHILVRLQLQRSCSLACISLKIWILVAFFLPGLQLVIVVVSC